MRVEWLGGVALLLLVACDSSPEVMRVEGTAMGMRWQAHGVGGEAERVQEELEMILERWEQAVSLWREDSEVVWFNQAPAGVWVAVGPELWAAVSLAYEIAGVTEGALDITMGPLVDLWGFGRKGRPIAPPDEKAIEAVKQRCGWSLLERDEAGKALRKKRADLELNVNAVVEGLVLEAMGRRLEAMGCRDFLIELGGTAGAGQGSWGWSLGGGYPRTGWRGRGGVFEVAPDGCGIGHKRDLSASVAREGAGVQSCDGSTFRPSSSPCASFGERAASGLRPRRRLGDGAAGAWTGAGQSGGRATEAASVLGGSSAVKPWGEGGRLSLT